MGFRTGVEAVMEIITVPLHDELDNPINVTAQIVTANLLVNKIAANDSDGLLNSNDLKEIERFLAAHFLTFRDQQYASSRSGSSSDTYQGKTGMYFDSSFYGQTAKMLDVTGYLAALQDQSVNGKKTISLTWLGKPDSEQIDYVDRD